MTTADDLPTPNNSEKMEARCAESGSELFGWAEIELEYRRERQAAGIRAAKARCVYGGRKKGTTMAMIMSNEFNFGTAMQDFGRRVLRDLIKTDYGPGATFDGIKGHGTEDHHGGPHDQINLFQEGVKGSGMSFRFFENS